MVPAAGTTSGVVKAKVPSTEATPFKVESRKDEPTLIAVAVGAVVIVGVALSTVTSTVPVTTSKNAVFVGVNFQLCAAIPTLGEMVGVVKVKAPATEALPPLSTESAKV